MSLPWLQTRVWALATIVALAACGTRDAGPERPLLVDPSSPSSDGGVSASGQDKVTLCHKGETLTVAAPAVPAHLGHGDALGACTAPTPSPTPTATPSPTPDASPSPSPTPAGSCEGLGAGYWRNWRNHYTEDEMLTLLAGTVAEDPADGVALADAYLGSTSCSGANAVPCMRRFLLANQLTINLTLLPELPNPDGGALDPSCTVPAVQGTLGEWIGQALAILADPFAFSRPYVLQVKDALEAFSES